ncbi:hypothetical protein [Emticicia sp. C21]|uniref:hypothetical protein n=1 Tax=Emticicia sp. C21 TaxID=2302915 RepID=UPI000E347906|nr:hypothetical protein [Emticicia sp. C21]RFS17471.1 hypothetical protein D0T08_06760 [Emticicia sp. C21]
MKKLLVLVLIITQFDTLACDICGCANGSAFVGLTPRAGTQFIGLRYRHRTYDSHLNSVLLQTRETYQTVELWGRFYPVKKVQVMVFLPYNSNHQVLKNSGAESLKNGLGDAIILGHVNVFNTFMDTTNTSHIYQSLMIGGGVKLATGKFEYGYEDEINPNFQLGTGSTDFLLSAIHTIKVHDWGLNTEIGGRISTRSNDKYRFGNRINGSLTAFYSKNWGVFSIMPNAGVLMDYGFRDIKEGQRNSQTGGFAALANTGLEMYYSRFNVGFSYRLPVYQNLGEGELKSLPQWGVNLTVNF